MAPKMIIYDYSCIHRPENYNQRLLKTNFKTACFIIMDVIMRS